MRATYLSVLCSLVLTACGGGGGGGANGDNAQIQSTPLVLTAVNYETVSQAALEGADRLSALSNSSSSSVFTGAQLETPPTWMPALVSQVKKIKSWPVGNTAVLSGVESSASKDCTYGGEVSVSVNDVNNNDELDAGDTMSFSFANCAFSNSEHINGGMSILVNSISSVGDFAAEIDMNLSDFSVVSGSTTSTATGDMRLRLQESSTNTSYSIGFNSMTSSATVSGVTNSFSMSGFAMTLTDALIGADQETYSGTLAMSRFANQSVVVSTTSPWLINDGANYPHAGQMLLTGKSGSKVRITAVSSSHVKLELDAAGDGVYEEFKEVTWASLK